MEKKKKHTKIVMLCFVIAIAAAALSGCVPGDGANNLYHPAGFFTGIWHGWIAPVSLVMSIFNRNITIYEVYNTGFFYNLGFYMAIISGFGGLSFARNKYKTGRRYYD